MNTEFRAALQRLAASFYELFETIRLFAPDFGRMRTDDGLPTALARARERQRSWWAYLQRIRPPKPGAAGVAAACCQTRRRWKRTLPRSCLWADGRTWHYSV